MDDWVDDEFSLLNLGDIRVNKTGKKIIKSLSAQPGIKITQVFNSSSEVNACYEFFHNGKVTAEKILKPHIDATLNRIRSEPIIILPQDTSSLNYSSKPSLEGCLGNISAKNNQGLFLHPLLAITPSRINLGIVDAKIWKREQREEKLTRKQIYELPIEKKERMRWAEGYKVACQIAEKCPNTQIISIADREGDFAELFEIVSESRKKEHSAHIIVRGDHDRILIDGSGKARRKKSETISNEEDIESEIQSKLVTKLNNSPSLGTIKFTIPSTKKREGREVTQVIKASQITFKKRMEGSPSVSMNVVMAIEESPPPGVEPLTWWFLTTLPIDTFEQCVLVIEYYLTRWEIEVFFKVLKSGCAVEERGITNGGLIPLIAVFLIIAWRIMYVMKLGRLCSEISAEKLFTASEWKPVFKVLNKGSELPSKPPSLNEFIIMIARLGGYLNRKNDPPPGPTVMWRGFNKMHTLAEAWESFG